MYEIEFFKNNNKQNIDQKKIDFIAREIKIKIDNNDYLITLDFLKKTCELFLKLENRYLNINVENMKYSIEKELWILEYTLETENSVLNIIKIKKTNA